MGIIIIIKKGMDQLDLNVVGFENSIRVREIYGI
jgi:hypothetical protein